MIERDNVTTGPPASFSSPAARAAEITNSGKPSKSSSPNSMNHSRSSDKRFWVNSVPNTASRPLISLMRVSSAPSKAEPERTNPRWVSIKTRACSSLSVKLSRTPQTVATRANNALLPDTSEKCAASCGEKSRCNASRAGLLSAPATV